jgi:hypothetical protein
LHFVQVSNEEIQTKQAEIAEERRRLAAQKGLEEAERNKIAKSLEKRENDLRKAQ